MNPFQAIVLGIIQGIGEFLPISSSGHLLLTEKILGVDTNAKSYMLLTVLLHVGTLVPLLIVFWKDWIGMICHPIKNGKLWLMLILASVPALVVHVIGIDDYFSSGWFLGFSFLVTAALLFAMDRMTGKKTEIGYREAAIMGCFQAVALLPGISRSGSTISGGVFSGLDKKTAAKFSFMMSAPAIGGSLLLEGKDALEEGTFSAFEPVSMILAIVVAGIVGYLALRFMLDLIHKIPFRWFAIYLVVIGVIYIILQLTGCSWLPALHPGAL